jgi:hypothetical protein
MQTVTSQTNARAIAFLRSDTHLYPGDVPLFETVREEEDYMLAWMVHIDQVLKDLKEIPPMQLKCLQSAFRFVTANPHLMDGRETNAIACLFLPKLLKVMEHYTTATGCNHQICRLVVSILVCVNVDRMQGGANSDEFCAIPYTPRLDEQNIRKLLDWTKENQAQFQIDEETRTQASAVLNKYLDQMKVDGKDREETHDVEQLIKWVEAGMFMSLVPLTPNLCVCESCRIRRAL